MRLDLYIAEVSQTSVSDWVARVSVGAQVEGIKVTRSAVRQTSDDLLPVVLDELCTTPGQRVEFRAADEDRFWAFIYETYKSRLERGWNVCLFSPSKAAIFLPFDERLLAERVAHLYYQEGTSDKIYDLYLAQALTVEFYSVISRYGRRGKKLQQTEKVFDYRIDEAKKEWDRLYHAKIQKGYQIGRPTSPHQLELVLPF